MRCGLFTQQSGPCTADGQSFDVPALALLWFDTAPQALTFNTPNAARPVGWWIVATSSANLAANTAANPAPTP